MPDSSISTKCAIAGGGPAGMMLGFLLARAGVAVVVMEKHADFFRDFRGDTVHPSTLELMYELGFWTSSFGCRIKKSKNSARKSAPSACRRSTSRICRPAANT